ncbi:MAG: DUF1587 domain-containing protein, partial [Planctomycetales bacterium]|nr:DUF1587 domain-containing protein [Planctomycetales bacterium]
MKSVGWTILLAILAASPWTNASAAEPPAENERGWLEVTAQYRDFVRPLLTKFCTDCHSPDDPKGELDLQRFDSLARVRADLRPWQLMIEQLESREMPPRDMPQPSAAERQRLVAWIRKLLDAEAREHAGDPGHVPLRRLSHAEYDRTIRDLTGVDLRPTREFPADGAAGEGFTNAAEALTMSPALMTKYLNAAKEVADHAVLLPDGFRFSPSQTRRDWTNESVARLREFYSRFTSGEGRLPLAPYLNALVRHRAELSDGRLTFDELARREQLSPRYLAELWRALHAADATFPLNRIQSRWQQTTPDNVDSLAAEIAAWQKPLWRFVPIGSYRYGATVRQVAQEPTVVAQQPLRFEIKPEPGEQAVTLHLVAHDYSGATSGDAAMKANVVWHR